MDASQFKPDVSRRQPGRLTVVALSRLVYRKGIDLLVVIIPEMCYRHPQVDFVIGKASQVLCAYCSTERVHHGAMRLSGLSSKLCCWTVKVSIMIATACTGYSQLNVYAQYKGRLVGHLSLTTVQACNSQLICSAVCYAWQYAVLDKLGLCF